MWNRQWPTQAVPFWAAHSWWAWREGFITFSQKTAAQIKARLKQVRKVKFFRPSWVEHYVGYKSTNDWVASIRPPIIQLAFQFGPFHVSPELLLVEIRGLSWGDWRLFPCVGQLQSLQIERKRSFMWNQPHFWNFLSSIFFLIFFWRKINIYIYLLVIIAQICNGLIFTE